MGQLTSEKQRELMKKYYEKYYKIYFPKYGKIVDYYIKKFFPKSNKSIKSTSLKSYQSKSKNVNHSLQKLAAHSFDKLIKKNVTIPKISKSREFTYFLYDFIYRRILIHEVDHLIYKHIQNENELIKCLKNPDDAQKLKYIGSGEYGSIYQLDEKRCIKFINVTHTLNNLKYVDFLKEITMSTIAGSIGVAPKIYDTYVCVNDEDSSCYGIIYMEYIQGMTLTNYLYKIHSKETKNKLRKLLEEKIIKLHNAGIMHNDLHSDNVMVIVDDNGQLKDIKMIDFGFAQYIKDYVYLRNHQRLNYDLFHFSREYIYNELANLIFNKLK